MKINAGKYKNKALEESRATVRASKQVVREAIFNILQTDIKGAKFLDLCCGTGSIGIEALSQGAESVTFVDIDCKLVRENTKALDANFTIIQSDARDSLNTPTNHDIIFLDPPYYDETLYKDLIQGISTQLKPGNIVIIEHEKKIDVEKWVHEQTPIPINCKRYKYGKSHLLKYWPSDDQF